MQQVIMMIRKQILLICLFISISMYVNGESINKNIERRQKEAMCGPICLQEICKIMGMDVSAEKIAQLSGTTVNGTSFKGLVDAAHSLGLKAYGLKTNINTLSSFERSVILHVQPNHFIVIKNLPDKKLQIFDPRSITRDRIGALKDIEKIWKGYVLVIEPTRSNISNQPAIAIRNPVFDFGFASQETVIKHDFIVDNIGQKSLEIQDVSENCSCTVTNLKNSQIPPGGYTIIRVQFNTQRKRGRLTFRLGVQSNDPDDHVTYITITGIIAGAILISPNVVYIEPVSEQIINKTLEVYDPGHGKLRVKKVITSSPKIKARILSKSQHEASELAALIQVTIKSGFPIGPIKEKVTIYTNDTKYPIVEVQIKGEAKGNLVLFPRQFFYGTLHIGQQIARELTIEYLGQKKFQISKIETNNPNVFLSISEIEQGRRYNLKSKFIAPNDVGVSQGSVKIYTNDGLQPVLEIPIYAIVVSNS